MLTREAAIKKVESFIQEILSSGIPLERAILFGSYARGNQHEYSDIDVALISDIFSGFGFEDRKHFSKINIKKEFVDIETKTYSTKYFDSGDPFYYRNNKYRHRII
ncbi:MAG: nucleotidyltransferase domain-containing protein [Saprospiraceae bacterium]|nr:nucleotidyltransferase domain-containing protein [Saprospiraceae bacterium]